MRGVGPAALCLVLAMSGCNREPSFDERYNTAQAKINKMDQGIERDLSLGRVSSEPADCRVARDPSLGPCETPDAVP